MLKDFLVYAVDMGQTDTGIPVKWAGYTSTWSKGYLCCNLDRPHLNHKWTEWEIKQLTAELRSR